MPAGRQHFVSDELISDDVDPIADRIVDAPQIGPGGELRMQACSRRVLPSVFVEIVLVEMRER